ncbi:MAG: DUF4157 domain-containing protein, partial [Bacteroidota bacterium]
LTFGECCLISLSAKVRKGIVIQIKFNSLEKDKQDADVDFEIIIAPNNFQHKYSAAEYDAAKAAAQQLRTEAKQGQILGSQKHVIVQGDYMSGDRIGIASSLMLDELLPGQEGFKIGALVAHKDDDPGTAQGLVNFYKNAIHNRSGKTRPYAVPVPARLFYSAGKRKFVKGTNLEIATFGTEAIKRAAVALGDNASDLQTFLRESWKDQNPLARGYKESKILEWVRDDLKLKKGNKYGFLWVKMQTWDQEKAYHYTSVEGWNQLQTAVKTKGYSPVLVGDSVPGIRPTTPSLVSFWNHPKYPPILQKDGRKGQLQFFIFLKDYGYNVVNIGMRSGAIEAPALVGLKTIFIEESGNQQTKRMEKWLKTLPGYYRIIVDAPLGGPQLRAYAKDLVLSAKQRYKKFKETGNQDLLLEAEEMERRVDELLPLSLKAGFSDGELEAIKKRLDFDGDLTAEGPKYSLDNVDTVPASQIELAGRVDQPNTTISLYNEFLGWLKQTGSIKGFSQPQKKLINQLIDKLPANPSTLAGSQKKWKSIVKIAGKLAQQAIYGQNLLHHSAYGPALNAKLSIARLQVTRVDLLTKLFGRPGRISSAESQANSVARKVAFSVNSSRPAVSKITPMPHLQREASKTRGYSDIGPGKPMEKGVRKDMEGHFGADFSKIQIHAGSKAIQANRIAGSRAFSVGSSIAFNQNQYTPQTPQGKELLAHELTHTLQTGAATSKWDAKRVSNTDSSISRKKDRGEVFQPA